MIVANVGMLSPRDDTSRVWSSGGEVVVICFSLLSSYNCGLVLNRVVITMACFSVKMTTATKE